MAVSGALIPLVIEARQGKRLQVRDLDGGSHDVATPRLYWVGTARVGNLRGLEAHWDAVSAAAAQIDVEALWTEVCAREPIPDAIAPNALVGEGVAADALVVAAFADPIYMKLKDAELRVVPPERVEAARARQREEERLARQEDLAVAALKARLAGKPDGSEDPEVAEAVARHLEILTDTAVFGREARDLKTSTSVLTRLGRRTRGDIGHYAFGLLVDLGELLEWENLVVRRAEVPLEFPPEVEAEGAELAAAEPRQRRPTDMTGLLTVAIDDRFTTEVDDAFAIEGDRLFVFIADVAAFVPQKSLTYREAHRRVSTIYVPGGKIPMLPEVLGSGAASLEEGVDRPALCFSAEIDGGRMRGFEVKEAIVRVDKRLTYPEADQLLAGEAVAGAPEGAGELLRRAAEWMDEHRERRRDMGALSFTRREIHIAVDAQGGAELTTGNPDAPGRQLISEMMVAVCAAVGGFCVDQQIPCVYRTQAQPEMPVPAAALLKAGPAERHAVLRTLKPTRLSTRPGGHATLAVDVYTQVTSPLRRFQDLLMNHQLKGWLRTRRPVFTEAELTEASEHIGRITGVLRRVENESRRFWTLRYLAQHPETTLEAVALREMRRGRWLVEIPELALQATFAPKRSLMVGDELRLRPAAVDARRDLLVLEERQRG